MDDIMELMKYRKRKKIRIYVEAKKYCANYVTIIINEQYEFNAKSR